MYLKVCISVSIVVKHPNPVCEINLDFAQVMTAVLNI